MYYAVWQPERSHRGARQYNLFGGGFVKFAICLLAGAAALAQNTANDAAVHLVATHLSKSGDTVRGSGAVKAQVGPLLLEGDESTLHTSTDEVEVRGHARVTLPERADRTVLRYGAGALITAQPIALSADRISIKYGLLRARGHVDARADHGRIQCDEIDLFLRIGDGDVRGNIRLNGDIPGPPLNRFPGLRLRFPPDIVK
jgi:lipopolysaccharide assembly outer membrane protein LptD (OstA)